MAQARTASANNEEYTYEVNISLENNDESLLIEQSGGEYIIFSTTTGLHETVDSPYVRRRVSLYGL